MAGFPGFDTSQYPGDQVMSWLKRNTNLTWTGFYLGVAPSHSQADWMNRRAVLVEQGWGFAPVYLGQQTTGPGSHDSSGPQGTIDGGQAVALMQAAGFPAGRCVYLDIENGPPLSALQIAYIAAWVNEVVAQGFQAASIARICWPRRSTPSARPRASGRSGFRPPHRIRCPAPIFRISTPPAAVMPAPSPGNWGRNA
jgi:hypothetical protein